MMLYRNTYVKARFPDGDRLLRYCSRCTAGDILAPYLFIICLDNELRTSIDKMKENGFKLTIERSRRYFVQIITEADYAVDIALLANTTAQAETLLDSVERAAAGIGLYVNAHNTEYMCFNQRSNITTLDDNSPKLVDKFNYLGSSVSSTETDINTRLAKAWIAIGRLSVIWKSNQTDKMKHSFFQAAVMSILLYGDTTWTLNKRMEKKLDDNYTRMLQAILNKSSPWGSIPQSRSCTATYQTSWNFSKLDELDMRNTAGEVRTNSEVMYSCGPLHMDAQRQDDQLEPTYSISVPIRDIALRICRKQRTIEKGGERGSAISVLMMWHDNDDDDTLFTRLRIFGLVGLGLVLWRIHHCRLFNAESIFIHINSSMSNNSV